MDDYTLSDNGYRRFTTKSNIFYKWFIDNASEYGWTVNRYATKKNATQKDRLLGISHYVDSNMETGNGDKVYLRVFCDIDAETQMRRIVKRNGEQWAEVFRTRWIPMEEQYFAAFSVKERCDIVYNTKG